MKRSFIVFVLVIVVVGAGAAGLAFYQNWLKLASNSGDGKAHITLTLDGKKFQADKKTLWFAGPTEKSKEQSAALSQE